MFYSSLSNFTGNTILKKKKSTEKAHSLFRIFWNKKNLSEHVMSPVLIVNLMALSSKVCILNNNAFTSCSAI